MDALHIVDKQKNSLLKTIRKAKEIELDAIKDHTNKLQNLERTEKLLVADIHRKEDEDRLSQGLEPLNESMPLTEVPDDDYNCENDDNLILKNFDATLTKK
jgi:hypothetical protein